MAGNRKGSRGSSKGQSNAVKAAKTTIARAKALPAEQQYEALLEAFTEATGRLGALEGGLAAATGSGAALEADHAKAAATVARLESLCRELERIRKTAKEENLARIKAEEEKRRDVSSKLNASMADISGLMERNTNQNVELREENAQMARQLAELGGKYEREQEEAQSSLASLEAQTKTSDAALAHAALTQAQATETHLRDKQKLLTDLQDYQDRITAKTLSELELRQQLGKYADQYEAFQDTLASSHGIMAQFREQMAQLTKKIKKLERESLEWQLKWKKCNTSIVDMVKERTAIVLSCGRLMKQNTKLQQLGLTLCDQLRREHGCGDDALGVSAADLAALTAPIEENTEAFVKVADTLFNEPSSKEPTPERVELGERAGEEVVSEKDMVGKEEVDGKKEEVGENEVADKEEEEGDGMVSEEREESHSVEINSTSEKAGADLSKSITEGEAEDEGKTEDTVVNATSNEDQKCGQERNKEEVESNMTGEKKSAELESIEQHSDKLEQSINSNGNLSENSEREKDVLVTEL